VGTTCGGTCHETLDDKVCFFLHPSPSTPTALRRTRVMCPYLRFDDDRDFRFPARLGYQVCDGRRVSPCVELTGFSSGRGSLELKVQKSEIR